MRHNCCILILVPIICCWLSGVCYSYEYQNDTFSNSFTVSSFKYPRTTLGPYGWLYIRVDLPQWFSTMSISLESDVDLDVGSLKNVPNDKLPMICFRDGSLPVPDISDSSLKNIVVNPIMNGSLGQLQNIQNSELCYPIEKNMSMKLTNEQISAGVWYLGLFNGIGSMRTQSKMINRGPSFSFSTNISVEGCMTSTTWGRYCNQTLNPLSCVQSEEGQSAFSNSNNRPWDNVISCANALRHPCHGDNELKVYFLDINDVAEQLSITATNISLNGTSSNSTMNDSEVVLMCFARNGAMPLATLHEYSGDINKASLVIRSPKIGRWFISILPVNLSKQLGETQNSSVKSCYSLEWQVLQCPPGKAGLNCTSDRYMLQTVVRRNPGDLFESYYLPSEGNVAWNSRVFPLKPLLSNSSSGEDIGARWTYFILDVPEGAAGGNVHVRLMSNAEMNYEIYIKYGGFPYLDSWDYFYANKTSNSNGSMYFKVYNSSEDGTSFYILYPREGTWTLGLRKLSLKGGATQDETTMSLSLERCPKGCSAPRGTCKSSFDASGLTLYSFCDCDRDHGGFDCSTEIVSRRGHLWQSIALIASNAAAVLPAFWALRQKAFAEWIIFTSSGISSGLYHACDVGTWCALSFHALQFMDFWLSFMAVVSTFLYLATIDESYRRTIHTAVFIFTALMAETGATRSANIVIVLAIGLAGLLIAWLVEFSTNYRTLTFSMGHFLHVLQGWRTIGEWIRNLVKIFLRRFRWGFVLAGATAFAMAAISWTLESTETYWIWHSVWHASIYTSSFLFLCSKANTVNAENEEPPAMSYELTRQDSFSGGS